MPPARIPIDPSLSVNEILRLHPDAVSVLNAHGIDTCCGGAMSLRAAALEARADLRTMIGEIVAIAAEPAR
jgi:iron-sulfur cluster repair protein YtfE (RIC family)